jgi:hypothetical protein
LTKILFFFKRGEKGYFRIIKGKDKCGMSKFILFIREVRFGKSYLIIGITEQVTTAILE